MARLHEHQGKAVLRDHGLHVPRGCVVRTPDEAAAAAEKIGPQVILKAQAWITGRRDLGGVVKAGSPEEASEKAATLLELQFGSFPVEEVLVEECLLIERELFVSLSIDDARREPVLLLECSGGTGIEDRAETVARIPTGVEGAVDPERVEEVLVAGGMPPGSRETVKNVILQIVSIARQVEARSLEINPLALTGDGSVVALDCRMTIDDYAVFRHPELGIAIAREYDHPATALERQAFDLESADHRGTFYFAQLPRGEDPDMPCLGFHGAGGGGSMMSMDAVIDAGFSIANFCDTSGNPSVAKVYRAARIILSQPGLAGYFGSGSGVASQEQYHSAYGLAKAFLELELSIPAVIRLGGNSEKRACEILDAISHLLPAKIEAYGKDDTPRYCAERMAALVVGAGPPGPPAPPAVLSRRLPPHVGAERSASFPITGGHVWIDMPACTAEACVTICEYGQGLFEVSEGGAPVLAVEVEEAADKDSELIACEVECIRAGHPVLFVDLPIPLLDGDREGGA